MKSCFLRYAWAIILLSGPGCKKNDSEPAPVDDPPVVISPQVDPELAKTIGFFMDDWQPENFTPPEYNETAIPPAASFKIIIDRSKVITKVSPWLFGNNANTWMTQMVTQPNLLMNLSKLRPRIIRYPGGSISDIFFWNAVPGSPPADAPAELLNASGASLPSGYWYGKNNADWTLSLDNYYSMLQQTGSTGIITINYGYARYGTGTDPVATAAHLAADWVRYDNGRTKYWEIGNENFGDWEAGYRITTANNQDAQPEYLSGQLYGQHFKVFADSMRKAASEKGNKIFIGAVTAESESPSGATATLRNWNTGLMTAAGNTPDFHVAHSYYTPYNNNSNATAILASAGTETGRILTFISKAMQDAGNFIKPIVLDEWNIFAVSSKQQVSNINGLHADLVLTELLQNKFGMACRWDLANGWDDGNDHGLFSNGDEPGVPRWNPRPAFFHLYYFQQFLGDRVLESSVNTSSGLSVCASSFSSGEVGAIVVNKTATEKIAEFDIKNFKKGKRFYWYTLSGGNDNGEFSQKVYVNGAGPEYSNGGPANYSTIKAQSSPTSGGIRVKLPGYSALFLAIDEE